MTMMKTNTEETKDRDMTESQFPFPIEGAFEQRVAEHPDWLEGIEFGQSAAGSHALDILR
jgi:hypothetical protein